MAQTNVVATEFSLSSVMARQNHRVSTLSPGEFNPRTRHFSTNHRKVKSDSGYVPFTIRGRKGNVTPPTEKGVISSKNPGAKILRRKDFPPDFKFGCSTSACQTEGSGTEGGRGPSIVDGYIQDDIVGLDMAADSYHRYKEDVQLLKNMGADTYRFSISWSRILPDGTVGGGINQEGINFYNNLIDELIKNGITPFVTLFHFDLPTGLQDKYSGFLNQQIVNDFKSYADLCFKTFGDRVKHWITVNEPQIFALYLYKIGLKQPRSTEATTEATDPFLVVHHLLLAHAEAAKLYKQSYQLTQKGEIGISLVTVWYEPHENTKQDIDASERALDFLVGWILQPMVYGDYPFIMKALVLDGLPTFTKEEKALVSGSYDFIGINYYTSRYATAIPFSTDNAYTNQDQFQHASLTADRNGVPIGEQAPGSDTIYVYPQGLRNTLVYLSKKFNNPKLYITENGYADKRDDTVPVDEAIQDPKRIQYILRHLYAVNEALKMGANVNGYFMWALMDSMEMEQGYNARFGLHYTDYLDNLNRIPKKSAGWFKSWVKT
ncbi:Beta-glucosidase 24 [Heracleum sosnowskyi]|uniref:Beta-glucosidase 24 n=1 Tax=Heracleum sosnowskyi TaxID=360622 RepID=A0AAD8N2L9_9APIA|nr:Beta-glucosidase 24 [Heracleum sosnowskyi]